MTVADRDHALAMHRGPRLRAPRAPGARRAAAAAVLAVALGGSGVAAAASPEKPRGKGPRTPANLEIPTLPDFWPDSPRVSAPGAGEPIAGRYIVVFEPGTSGSSEVAKELVASNEGSLKYTYGHALKGFAAELSADAVEKIGRHPNVVRIEQDRLIGPAATGTTDIWGLDRIDQRLLPLDRSYTDGNAGAGVHAYVIDTGIRGTHGQFVGRMGNGYDAITPGGAANDCNGHGTHVAGTIGGGIVVGVANKVVLHPVRVLNCNGLGSTSSVIAGIDWVTRNHVKPAVANLGIESTGTGVDTSVASALGNAVASSIGAGVTYTVPAGNENRAACTVVPAAISAAITVGATTNTDSRAPYSNHGRCLDLFAPGSNTISAGSGSDWEARTLSGTSMASAHAAGAAAIHLSANPTASPAQVRDALVKHATPGRVLDAVSDSPNLLLALGGVPPLPPAPANALVNGDFETVIWTSATTVYHPGWSKWTNNPGGDPIIGGGYGRTGTVGVKLGDWAGFNAQIGQSFTVPANGVLRYWWKVRSQERWSQPHDYLSVHLHNATTGAHLADLRTWSNANARDVWNQDTISLAAWAGKPVHILFRSANDSYEASAFHLDDISVTSG